MKKSKFDPNAAPGTGPVCQALEPPLLTPMVKSLCCSPKRDEGRETNVAYTELISVPLKNLFTPVGEVTFQDDLDIATHDLLFTSTAFRSYTISGDGFHHFAPHGQVMMTTPDLVIHFPNYRIMSMEGL
ncbi:hypothetical protein TNCV_2042901 [Trichonephila clavipes]|nr:hypothetical protein TNCV_2042901 [Trichonephila clavipes]